MHVWACIILLLLIVLLLLLHDIEVYLFVYVCTSYMCNIQTNKKEKEKHVKSARGRNITQNVNITLLNCVFIYVSFKNMHVKNVFFFVVACIYNG